MNYLIALYHEYSTMIATATVIALVILPAILGIVVPKWRFALLGLTTAFAAINAADFSKGRLDQKAAEAKLDRELALLQTRINSVNATIDTLNAALVQTSVRVKQISGQSDAIRSDLSSAEAAVRELPSAIGEQVNAINATIVKFQTEIEARSADTSKSLSNLTRDADRRRVFDRCRESREAQKGGIFNGAFPQAPCNY